MKILFWSPSFLKNIFGGVLITFCFAVASLAQQPTPTPPVAEDDGEVIKVNSKLVVVPVSVIDANGQPVTNLTAPDFRLEEEGRPQEVAEISSAEQVPLEIVLLLDVSSSTNTLFDFEKAAAARFLQDVMKSEDRASIVLVNSQPSLIQGRNTAAKSAETLRTVQAAQVVTQTAFYDAVLLASAYLKKNAPERSRRIILSLGDGVDNWSNLTREAEKNAWRDFDVNTLTQKKRDEIAAKTDAAQRKAQENILRDLQNADTVFYSVNPAGSSLKLNKMILRGQNGLQKFADDTGGTAFLPEFLPAVKNRPLETVGNARRNEENLEKIFRQIAAELRAQYLVQYYSEAEFPSGKYVRLKVNLPNKNALRVRARQGYFAGKGQ